MLLPCHRPGTYKAPLPTPHLLSASSLLLLTHSQPNPLTRPQSIQAPLLKTFTNLNQSKWFSAGVCHHHSPSLPAPLTFTAPSDHSHSCDLLTTTPLTGDAKDNRDQVYNADYSNPQEHQSSLSHEALGSAAAFEAMHLWENQQRKEGKTVDHGVAKELLAAAAGFEVDKLVETKGLDFIDREKAKHQAKKQAEHLYDQQYSDLPQYDP